MNFEKSNVPQSPGKSIVRLMALQADESRVIERNEWCDRDNPAVVCWPYGQTMWFVVRLTGLWSHCSLLLWVKGQLLLLLPCHVCSHPKSSTASIIWLCDHSLQVCNAVFRSTIILFQPGGIRDHFAKLSEISPKFWPFGSPNVWGRNSRNFRLNFINCSRRGTCGKVWCQSVQRSPRLGGG